MSEPTANIVAAFGTTHTPGLGHQMDKPDPAQIERIVAGFDILRAQLEEAKPDVLIAFINDHWDMFTLLNMPGFAVGWGDTHWGPRKEAEARLGMTRQPVPGHTAIGKALAEGLTKDGFEVYRFPTAEFVHNVMLPKKFIWPAIDIPVVPVFINCFAAPLPTWRRSYELGLAVRRALAGRPERIAMFASGGISHWPPITTSECEDESDPLYARLEAYMTHGQKALADDPTLMQAIMGREEEMLASGRVLVDAKWDMEILQHLADADIDYIVNLDNDDVIKNGGSGGPEMLLWAALLGAMEGAKSDIVMYEEVKEWRGGVGLTSYARSIAAAR